MRKLNKLDANDLAFIERQLEFVRAKSYDVKYPQLKARMLIPVDNTPDPGAETVKYNQYDMVGLAKLISSYAQDLPRADVRVKEFRAVVKSMGVSYAYNIQELRAAAMAGMPLEARKANAARRAFEELVDRIGSVGDSANGLLGILNQPNALSATIPNNAGATSTLWKNKTGLEMLKDLNSVAVYSVQQTNGIEVPDTMAVPIAQFSLIATTPLQTGVQVTVLSQFLQTSPYIKTVTSWYKLGVGDQTSGPGSGGTDRLLCYRRDPDALMLVIPQEFEQFPFQQKGLEFLVPCHGRIAGVQVPYPLSIVYGDGI
jgi:hypothetical protein